MAKLDNTVAIITGGGGFIGPFYGEALGAEGARIAVLDIDLGKAEAAVERLAKSGVEAKAFLCDITKRAQTLDVVAQVEAAFGRIDILINNAGYATLQDWDTLPEDEWDKVMDINIKGAYLMSQAVTPIMKRQGWGKIVNLASSVTRLGPANLVHYVAAKSAVIGFTRALARAVGNDGITVNAIAPGFVTSQVTLDFYPQSYFDQHMSRRSIKRQEYPADLVGSMLHLCTHDSDFVTGQTIFIDGGYVMQ